jgi:translocation and assembly module TamB
LIRLIYWLLALIEVVLILAVLILFIITDSRSIKYIAEKSLDSYGLSYESIEGNLFDGLELKELSYENKPLFSSALIHWNPLTLFYDKITVTKLDAKGIEVENIIAMVKAMKLNKSGEKSSLDFDLILNNIHLDINPYVYEGVKFSSFIFETGKIEIDKDLKINVNRLYLKFDSDIVNVAMKAKIKDSYLLVDNLDLKNISAKDITKLTHRIKSKYKEKKSKVTAPNKNNKMPFFKDIKIKHILGTMKPTQYGDLKIEGVTLHIYDGVIEPANNFKYQVRKVDFKGLTNFGNLDYKGHIKDSNILAKGYVTLDKELLKKYSLPLNFNGLKKLPSTLRLNHYAVWIDIDHKIQKLLKIKSDFNLDVSKAKHKLHYDYSDKVFTVDSDIAGQMTYANAFKLKNKILIDEKGFSYGGDISLSKLKDLPAVVSEYLVTDLSASYEANSHDFEMDLDSKLLTGHLSMPKYKGANVSLKSKMSNIKLDKFLSDLPLEFRNERISLDSKSFFDFKNLNQSKIKILAQSNILDLEAKMKLEKPYEISFKSTINDDATLREMIPKLKFSKFKHLNGSVILEKNRYLINVKNQQVKFFMDYNSVSSIIEQMVVNMDEQEFIFERKNGKNLIFQTNVSNIQGLFDNAKSFYIFEPPNIQGEVDLRVEQQSNGTFWINFKSPKLQYLSEESVDLSILNFYNIDTTFKIDKNLNIEIENYQFKLDENGYLNSFYSNKVSSLVVEESNLKINKLWLNDKVEITGNYNLKTLQGKLKIDADKYELSTKDFALILDLDLSMQLDKERLNIEGDIDILGDTITYEVVGSDIVEDADIIIVENIIREKESAFNNLKLYIKVKSKKPLNYIAENVNVEFLNELSLLKNYNQKMLLTGVTTITKGYYALEDKQFILDESHLYFTGDIKTPLLDIKANYTKDEYNVHVFISGTTDAPIVNFNSEPYLTQQEILSLILFDGTGSSSGNGAEAYTLLGGTFAKGLIKSLGIDVDHLLLGQDRDKQLSVEVGRKISKNISVLYLHKDGLDGAKVRIEHSRNFETDIIIQPPNTSSIEFLYKQDK